MAKTYYTSTPGDKYRMISSLWLQASSMWVHMALLAIFMDEPEAPQIEFAIDGDAVRLISTATVLETSIVVEARLGEAGGRELDLLLHKGMIEIVPVDRDQLDVAREAYRSYGKGRHAAGLNFGDCFAYSLTKVSGEPLLCKGEDFRKTDLVLVRLER